MCLESISDKTHPNRVLIDADGCPVVAITVSLAKRYSAECIILSDTAHEFGGIADARVMTVSKGADSVDFALVNLARPRDIVITQDYGLAAMCLARGTRVLNQNGMRYTGDNIDSLLDERYMSKKARSMGIRMKGHSKRSHEQDEAFKTSLEELLRES